MARYEVLRPEYGETVGDGKEFDAMDHEDAAVKRAEYDCQQDPESFRAYEDGVELSVYPVWLGVDAKPFRLTVTGSMHPTFVATRTK